MRIARWIERVKSQSTEYAIYAVGDGEAGSSELEGQTTTALHAVIASFIKRDI